MGYVCGNIKGRIDYSMGRRIGNVPILVAEAIAIHEALRTAIHLNMDNLITESDSQIIINSILYL